MTRSTILSPLLGLLGLTLLVAAVVAFSQSTDAAGGATVSLVPSSQNVDVGDSFTIDVNIEGATNIAAFEFRIVYNTDILRFDSVSGTDFLGTTGRSVKCHRSSTEPGVRFGCATSTDPDSGYEPVSGSGTLAHITFTALNPGTSYLTFKMLELADKWSNSCCSPVSVREAAVRVIGEDEPTPEAPPATPTLDPTAMTPTPGTVPDSIPGAMPWLTPSAGETPMSRLLPGSDRPGGTGPEDYSASGGARSGSGSPIAGTGPGEGEGDVWPTLLGAVLAGAGALLLSSSFYLKKWGTQRTPR